MVMQSRRAFVGATATACTVALAGCLGGDDGNDETVSLNISQPEFDEGAFGGDESFPVTVDVTNPGPTSDVQVTLTLLDENEGELNSYQKTVEIGEEETKTVEFTVEPNADVANVDVDASVVEDNGGNQSDGE